MRSPVSYVTGFRFSLEGGVSYPPHRHRAIEIVLHAAGSGVLHLPGGLAVPFVAGEVSICPGNQLHHQAMREPGSDLCVLLTSHADQAAPVTSALVVRRPLGATLTQEISDLTHPRSRPGPTQRAELDLRTATVLAGLLALAQPCEAAVHDSTLAEEAARLLMERHATLTSLGELARALAVSPAHLRQRFTAHHGMPPLRYLTQVRVERAKDLLAHSSLSLREIAQACGLGSEQYLCAVFRRMEGKAPGAFRK